MNLTIMTERPIKVEVRLGQTEPYQTAAAAAASPPTPDMMALAEGALAP
jgi:hypothetical protein